MAKSAKKGTYVEPLDYFPKSVRKAAKIGEYADTPKKATSKKVKRSK